MNNSGIFDYYKISKGDTLYKIAMNSGIDPKVIAILNGLNVDDYIYPEQVLLIPKRGMKIYVSVMGDTLDGVVDGLGANMDEFIEQNKKIYLQPEQLMVYKKEN